MRKDSSLLVREKYRWSWIIAISLCLSISAFTQEQSNDLHEIQEFARALLRAKTQEERRALLVTKKQLVTVQLRKALLVEGNSFLAEGRYAEALDAFGQTSTVADQIGDKAGIGAASLNIGTVHYLLGDYERALANYQKARLIFEERKDGAELARALVGIGYVHKEQGRRSEALKDLQQALAQLEALGTQVNKEELSDVLNAIGSIHSEGGNYGTALKFFQRSSALLDNAENILNIGNAFESQGNFLQALEYYQKALTKLDGQKAGAAPGIITALLGSLANVHYRLGNYELALQYYQRNFLLLERFNDKSGLAVTLEGMGNVYRMEGDFARALESYLRSVKFAEESGGKVNTAAALGSIGLVRALQGDSAEALKYYARSLEQFETSGNKLGMARVLVNIGNSYSTRGNFEEGLAAFQKGLVLREEMGDKASVAEILLGIGATYAAQRSFAKTLESFQRAFSVFEQLIDKEGMANALKGIAVTYALQGEYSQALGFAERAAPLAAQADAQDLRWHIYFEIGKYNRALGQPIQARQAFEEAIQISQALQSRPSIGDRYKTSPQELLGLYAELVSLLVEEEKTTEAFFYADLAKVQALRSVLRQNELRINKTLTPLEKAKEQKLTSALVALDLQAARERQRRQPDQTVLLGIDNQFRQTRKEQETFKTKLWAAHPRLPVYRGQVPQLKSLEEASSLLTGETTAFLQYVITERQAYLFVLTGNPDASQAKVFRNARERSGGANLSLKVYPLSIQRRDLVERIANLRQSIQRRDETFAQSALQLYDLLLRPAEEQLKAMRTLFIAPDRELWALPFQALQPSENHYLIEQAAVSYVPSLSILREMAKPRVSRASKSLRPTALIVFGNPKRSKEIEARVSLSNSGPISESLLDVEPELQKIKRMSGPEHAKIYTGAEAREDRAKAEVNNYGILYFATRSVIDGASPLYSYVVLAEDEVGHRDDGLLQAWEIMQLDSQARVVLLPWSATARGQLEAGSAVVGMMWAWFVSGSPTTLISQWTTASTSTAELMAGFHLNLNAQGATKKRRSKAEALKLSIQQLRQNNDYKHPYYWAGFVVMGDGR